MSKQTSGENSPAPYTGGLTMDLAMDNARANPTLQGDVAAFFRNQDTLIDIQNRHEHFNDAKVKK